MPPVTRPLEVMDAVALTALYTENRQFLAPWMPLRPGSYFTEAGQHEAVEAALSQQTSGRAAPLVILDRGGDVAGTLTLASIIRGAFQRAASATGLPIAPKVRDWRRQRCVRLPTSRSATFASTESKPRR